MEIAKISPIAPGGSFSLSVPGSKSYSLRALLIGAMCNKPVSLTNLLISDDTAAMKNCLQAIKARQIDINANESGLTARFITAMACISPGTQVIDGAPGLRKRPIKDLVDALRKLGANIKYLDKEGFLPLKITSSKLSGNQVSLSGNISSQYLSAFLLIGPKLENGLQINIEAGQTSKPYVDMTIDIMNYFGVEVENHNYRKYIIKPQRYMARDYAVENDYSSASYFFAIAALTGSAVTVDNLKQDSKQADKQLLGILAGIGADVRASANSVTVTGSKLMPIDIDMNDCPDQAMTVAVLAAFVNGKSMIKGIGSLRIKETERILALENELAKMGIGTESTVDSLTIYGRQPISANIDTYGDHRMAMSFAVAATKLNKLSIFNPKVVNKTFPGFWTELEKVTAVKLSKLEYSNIILTGMRGTGKSTVGRIMAKRLSMQFVDVDKYIESKNNLNIKLAVQNKGWEYFRQLETSAITELSKKPNTVISTGAGAILDEENVKALRKNSLVFMLKAAPATLASRINRYNKLPALTKHGSVFDELEEVWQQRKTRYYASCDFIIETENLKPEQVSEAIIAKL